MTGLRASEVRYFVGFGSPALPSLGATREVATDGTTSPQESATSPQESPPAGSTASRIGRGSRDRFIERSCLRSFVERPNCPRGSRSGNNHRGSPGRAGSTSFTGRYLTIAEHVGVADVR